MCFAKSQVLYSVQSGLEFAQRAGSKLERSTCTCWLPSISTLPVGTPILVSAKKGEIYHLVRVIVIALVMLLALPVSRCSALLFLVVLCTSS